MTDGKGAVAQLGERLVCNQEATGSIPVSSTISIGSGRTANCPKLGASRQPSFFYGPIGKSMAPNFGQRCSTRPGGTIAQAVGTMFDN